jgi:hypothetical protein
VPAEKTFVPNLIVLGTPKSGTSSLYRWLAAHPDIGSGSTKELRFLMDPEEPLARENGYAVTGLEGYAAWFPRRTEAAKAYWLDVSPTYYYQKCALEVIGALEDKPFLGMVFRRPGQRIHSFFQFAKHNTNVLPTGMGFEAFLEAIEQGPKGPLKGKPSLYNLFDHADYAKYVEMWLERAPRERMFFLTFDELRRDQRGVMHKLCAQLGLDSAFYDSYGFPQENRSYEVRNRQLHALMRQAVRKGVPLPRPARVVLRNVYEKLNAKELRREHDDRTIELVAALDRRFAPSVARLEQLTGLDLAVWQQTAPSPGRTPLADEASEASAAMAEG